MTESAPVQAETDPSQARRARAAWLALWLPIVVGIGASSLLLVDYLRPAPLFCGAGGGCDQLRHSPFSSWFGVPTPLFGVLAFAALAVVGVLRGERARQIHMLVAAGVCVVGAFLLALQLVLRTFCVYCTFVDLSALASLATAYFRVREAADRPEGRNWLAIPLGAVGAACFLPLSMGLLAPHEPVPEVIAEEAKRTPPGKVTIVDFIDYECPFCRRTHADLQSVVEPHKDRVRVVRKNVPLDALHPHARAAARGAVCADDQLAGDAMSDLLVATPTLEFTDEGLVRLAKRLQLDEQRFRLCLQDPVTDKRIEADREVFRASGGQGLPTIWIGDRKIEGMRGPEALKTALDAALAAEKRQ
jgi:protein-disulfide isomerase/uncharacterized membrane protein